MIELIALAVFAALIWFFLKNKKQAHGTRPKNLPEAAKPKQEAPQEAPKVTAPSEKTTPAPAKPVVQTASKSVAQSPRTVSPVANRLLPQDATLQRHYLTQLRAIINTLNPCPTDSALSRHHATQLLAHIEQCVHSEAAITKLMSEYEHYTQPVKAAEIINEPAVQLETTAEIVPLVTPHKESKLPKDSVLRRHYVTHLQSQIAAKMPPRPTDSTLRRHYNALLESEVQKQLH